MSASPPQPTQSAKRPLEEASSPSRATDQPEAKRPALDKVSKNDEETEKLDLAPEPPVETAEQNGEESANGVAATEESTTATDAGTDTKATPTVAISTAASSAVAASAAAHDESSWIHIRAVISSPEAATIIGKGGENVSNIRKMSNAKCTVSDYQKGAVERILTVSGIVDAVAKVRMNQPPPTVNICAFDLPLRLLIPHILIGSIIGKGGSRIREIQEASGARLNASDSCLPMSSERSLVVMGVADAVHIATYYVGSTLLEQLNERFGGPAASAYATRSGAPVGSIPGGMQVVPYSPQPASGHYGRAENYGRHQERRPHHMPPAPYPQPYPHGAPHGAPAIPMQYGAGQPAAAYGAAAPHGQPMHAGMPGTGPITQQIYIPNDMVGAIIGKGGQKINEIRQMSGSVIKINEPQDNSNERLVTITGTEECNRMALYMLYSRLGETQNRSTGA
ncbi:hypothetical protein TrVFT333_007267 [Trichoderma virens FT-333]|nr:hypothetical protein TrVFT333_007267 [Trichoderma virens FT-333]